MRKLFLTSLIIFYSAGCGPSDFERQKLAFEQQKYKAVAIQKEADEKDDQQVQWRDCRSAAVEEYYADFERWSKPAPGKPGNGPANQLQEMKDRLFRKVDQCNRNFPKGVNSQPYPYPW